MLEKMLSTEVLAHLKLSLKEWTGYKKEMILKVMDLAQNSLNTESLNKLLKIGAKIHKSNSLMAEKVPFSTLSKTPMLMTA